LKAIELFDEILEVEEYKDNALVLNNKAVILAILEKNKVAMELLEKVIKLDPLMIKVYFNLAFLYFKEGNMEKALKYFETYHFYFPNDTNSHFLMGNIYKELKDFSSAIKEYELSTFYFKQNVNAIFAKAEIYFMK